MTRRPAILVGLPYSQNGRLADEVAALGAPVMVSTGAHYRANRGGFQAFGQIVRRFHGRIALDSAGFVAMKRGGYQWDVSAYVDFVRCARMAGGESGAATSWGSPFRFWSAMDFCVEPEIAGDEAEVARRVELTAEVLGETLDEVDYWTEEEGDDLEDPLPILQGQAIADYLRSVELTGDVLESRGRSWPALVGVGSVCRRDVDGDEGLLALLRALDEALPAGVRLHLFGVKGELLGRLDEALLERVESVDSMAWDFRARKEARAAGMKNTVEHRAGWLRRWFETQNERLDEALASLTQTRSETPSSEAPMNQTPIASQETPLVRGRMEIAEALLGHYARFVLVSRKTGASFELRLRRADPREGESPLVRPWFVHGLDGDRWRYLGCVHPHDRGLRYLHGRKSDVPLDSKAARAVTWFFRILFEEPELLDLVDVAVLESRPSSAAA